MFDNLYISIRRLHVIAIGIWIIFCCCDFEQILGQMGKHHFFSNCHFLFFSFFVLATSHSTPSELTNQILGMYAQCDTEKVIFRFLCWYCKRQYCTQSGPLQLDDVLVFFIAFLAMFIVAVAFVVENTLHPAPAYSSKFISPFISINMCVPSDPLKRYTGI